MNTRHSGGISVAWRSKIPTEDHLWPPSQRGHVSVSGWGVRDLQGTLKHFEYLFAINLQIRG